ncbi:MAG: hypothetical protein A2479_01145 [Candidatus Magasanikbacteria bacterium RIFOXYC2_FULL_39_8]|nr:MAG: hypothetical protein A2479_01145 [Candidatus Magasanikbacteria bacterium RIFOXYC2_FULL_39_8]
MKLEKGENKDLQKKALMYMDQRNKTQPKGNSSGCIFKNVECNMMNAELLKNIPAEFVERGFIPAGWLIDQCGLKGYRVGNAEVSEMHGNFIVNLGGATAEDILSIVDRIKEDVYTKFSINLEEEIFII